MEELDGRRVSIRECYRGLPGLEFVLGDFARGFIGAVYHPYRILLGSEHKSMLTLISLIHMEGGLHLGNCSCNCNTRITRK